MHESPQRTDSLWSRKPAPWISLVMLIPCHPFLFAIPCLRVVCARLSLQYVFDIAGVFDVQARALLPGKGTWHDRRASWPGFEICSVVCNVGVFLLARLWIIHVLKRPYIIPVASFIVKVIRARFVDPGGRTAHWKIDCVRGEHCKRGHCNCQLVHLP